MDPHLYGHLIPNKDANLILNKDANAIQLKSKVFLTNGARTTRYP